MDKCPPKTNERIQEGFPHQRLVALPPQVLARCRALPLVSQLHVTHIGAFPSAPHHYVERKHGLAQTILLYCPEGRGWLELEGRGFGLEPGHIAIIPPNTTHIYHADPTDPWSLFWIHFDGPQCSLVCDSLGVNVNTPLLYVADTNMMRQAFEEVYACLNYNHSDAGLLAMTSELMCLLSRIKLNSSTPHRERQAQEDRIQESIRFMEKHLDMPIPLKDLAARAGQSVPHYSKLFRERTDQSPMAYFIQLKIRKACDLLYQTDLTIREIGEQLGYSDPYYFSRIFKKIQGIAPAKYRCTILR